MPCPIRRFLVALTIFYVALPNAFADLSPTALLSLTTLAATRGYTAGLPEMVTPAPSGANVYFLRSGPKDDFRCLYDLDTVTGITLKLLDPINLGKSGAGLTSFQLSSDGSEILVPYYGKLFLVRLSDKRLLSFAGDGYHDPVLSPDGSSIASVKNYDIVAVNVADGRVKSLTSGGNATVVHGLSDLVDSRDFGRNRGFWWSPDSRSIAYVESDSSRTPSLQLADYTHPDEDPTIIRYPYAGSSNAAVRLGIVSAAGGKTTWVNYNARAYPYLVRVVWQQARAPMSIVALSRDQRDEELMTVSTGGGGVHTLLKETDRAWVSVAPDAEHSVSDCAPYWLSDGSGFLWLTESSGDWNIEIRDAHGAVIRQATPSGLHVRGIDDVNEQTGAITFEADSDARQCQLYRTDFKGGACVPVTHTIGVHSAVFSSDHKVYADSYSLADGESGADIFSAAGVRLSRLPSLADTPPSVPNVKLYRVGKPQLFDAAVIFPQDLKKLDRYPVILMLNSGFGKNQVTTAINGYADAQWYADQGFIVVCADVDGAPDRGRETEETVKDDLLDLPLDDQADAITELAKAVPEIDFTRVGVVGEGACGGLAIAGPIRRPYIFACGAAVSPITDWSIVETGLAERYLGLPSVDPSGYKTSSAITYTVHSQRPLLVLQSAVAADSTFAGSLKLAETMYQTGKPIDFVPIAVDTEGTLKPDDQIALHSRLLQFFKEQLKP